MWSSLVCNARLRYRMSCAVFTLGRLAGCDVTEGGMTAGTSRDGL